MLRVTSYYLGTRRGIAHLVRPVKVQAQIEAYSYLRKLQPKLYRNAPEDGKVEFTVDYLDTWRHRSQLPSKVIVAIHGCPDDYNTYKTLAEDYENSDIRLVVPNLPDMSHTRKTGFFWHSPEEKGQFMKALLATLNIERIDCLVCHSLGMPTSAQIFDQPGKLDIGSVALFSPFPQWNFKITPTVFRNTAILNTFPRSALWPRFFTYGMKRETIVPMKVKNIEKYQLLITTVVVPDKRIASTTEGQFERLVRSGRPVAVVYGNREKIVHPDTMKKFNQIMGIPEQQVIQVNSETDRLENIPLPSQVNSPFTSYMVDRAGHVAHMKWPQFSHALLNDIVWLAK